MADPGRTVIWSPDAQTDLSQIWNYYVDAAGEIVADRRVREIHAACHKLERHPFAGRSRDELRAGLRSVLADPHVVFYRIRNERAEIVRVLDGRQDLDDIFAHGQ